MRLGPVAWQGGQLATRRPGREVLSWLLGDNEPRCDSDVAHDRGVGGGGAVTAQGLATAAGAAEFLANAVEAGPDRMRESSLRRNGLATQRRFRRIVGQAIACGGEVLLGDVEQRPASGGPTSSSGRRR